METITPKEQAFAELDTFLNEQIIRVEQTLGDLNILRAAVVRRDEGALDQLQDQLRQETQRKAQMEIAQQRLRQRFSSLLDCHGQEVTVSRICQFLDPPQRQDVQILQKRLQGLVRKLQNEHQATELMLRECARFNRVLLSCLIGDRNQTRTYSVQGKEQWNVQRGLMNIQM